MQMAKVKVVDLLQKKKDQEKQKEEEKSARQSVFKRKLLAKDQGNFD